jgi:hypothetical protein
MKRLSRLTVSIAMIVIIYPLCHAQELIWNAGFHGFFDNREYFNDYAKPQTIFGSRAFGYAGYALSKNHETGFGINMLYEFGDSIRKESFNPILFYSYTNQFTNLKLGAFPRKNLIDLPLFLLSDTIQYYRPNLEGIFLNFFTSWGYQNLWLDWTSRQDDYARETFKIGGTGTVTKGIFFYRHDFIMTHYAGPSIPIPDDHIRDNGGLYSGLGLDFSGITSLDSLIVSSGLCLSYDRLRNVYDLRLYYGSLTQITAEYKGLGVKSSFYFGDGQNQIDGDKMYTASQYSRFDFYWRLFRKSSIQGRVEFSLHLVNNVLDTSQLLTIYAVIGGRKSFRQN